MIIIISLSQIALLFAFLICWCKGYITAEIYCGFNIFYFAEMYPLYWPFEWFKVFKIWN